MFRERLITLGMSSSHVTTIINTNPAVSACTGLLNGPMFRRFTFRQVAMVGALLCFSGILLTAFCETFAGYMFAYALLYGECDLLHPYLYPATNENCPLLCTFV